MTDTAQQTDHNTAYQELESHVTEMAHISRVLGLLSWDRTVMMPRSGAEARAEQYSLLSKIRHERISAPLIGDLIAEADAERHTLSDWQQANLREIQRLYKRATAIPADLQQKLSHLSLACETQWEHSRPENDFATVRPLLAELVDLTREGAVAIAEACDMAEPYDALLDEFDKGAAYTDIQPLFAELEDWLPQAVDDAIEKQEKPLCLGRGFDVNKQKELSEFILHTMGYKGRFDTSPHPFSSGRLGDVRITTRYTSDSFIVDAVLSVMHEAGHGIYDMQIPEDWGTQPVSGAFDISMAIHESQAMVMERQIGQSRVFWEFIAPKCRDIFGAEDNEAAWQADNLYKTANWVEKGLIRVEADEMTYPLHILLRTKLEKAMIDGDLQVQDLPDAWNDEMQNMLGITPPDDDNGCMQDPHWYGGCFGYFPSYLLGAMNASQIFQAAKRSLPGLEEDLKQGQFTSIRDWLKENVHGHGCFYPPRELIKAATGDYLQLASHKNHLTKRYLQQ